MKSLLFAACALAALAVPGAAAAQHQDHSQHAPPAPPPPPLAAAPRPAPELGEDHSHHGPQIVEDPHGGHGEEGGDADPSATRTPLAALGPYPMSREASGTAWQPDRSLHSGLHLPRGDWTLMAHALVNGVYDWQQGPRGDEMGFVSGMVMASARTTVGDGGMLQLRAMLSPDPLMGARGYPLHLAAGETADGASILVDRQHPHDLFMELSASYSLRIGGKSSLFVYGGLPGAPAFGPPAFMHRMSAMDSPEAPITHHWLDSTHIAFGVITAGLVVGDVKIEASRFNGREPNQHRWDIETGPLDSTAVRISLNPARSLSLQASWARLIAPEQLEPDENETRWSASALYTRPLGDNGGWWSSTLAWGRRDTGHDSLDAFTLESAAGIGGWTLFARAERIETNELLSAGGHHGPVFEVAKLSAGLIRDVRLGEHVRLGAGGLYALNFVPAGLETSYGGDPEGAMLFLRLRID
ncbi:hypothetical protein [Allosphingosinicella sp.]|jgi:hypothetical protein|uniref:hypothetical protein n=1 Tax=Allosphingosinicella sp. TaxID=2823234 RepID=UPI002EF6FB30